MISISTEKQEWKKNERESKVGRRVGVSGWYKIEELIIQDY